MEAIREIVINMIVHRDYRSSADSIVKIFENSIEFYNPGHLPEDVTIDDLLSGDYKSNPRNKLIADVCKDMHLIEKYGSGIGRIRRFIKEEGLPDPDFRTISDGFQVTVFGESINKVRDVGENLTIEKSKEKSKEKGKEKGKEKSKEKILGELYSNPTISINELAEKTGLSVSGVEKNLKGLKQKGIIRRIGPAKGGHWEISVDSKDAVRQSTTWD